LDGSEDDKEALGISRELYAPDRKWALSSAEKHALPGRTITQRQRWHLEENMRIVRVCMLLAAMTFAPLLLADDQAREVGFSGDSHADDVLKQDTLRLIQGELSKQGCDAVDHVNVKSFLYEATNRSKGHVWAKEGWMVTACGKGHRFYVLFEEDGQGGNYIKLHQ
jgi:hypothetical protein